MVSGLISCKKQRLQQLFIFHFAAEEESVLKKKLSVNSTGQVRNASFNTHIAFHVKKIASDARINVFLFVLLSLFVSFGLCIYVYLRVFT